MLTRGKAFASTVGGGGGSRSAAMAALFASAAAAGADSFWKFAEKGAQLTGFEDGLANSFSIPKLQAAIKGCGLTFEGKALGEQGVKALKNLSPFVSDKGCCTHTSWWRRAAPSYAIPRCSCALRSSARQGIRTEWKRLTSRWCLSLMLCVCVPPDWRTPLQTKSTR